ncbi:MAG: leucine-rich repeat domain-containing protein [Lachnospiraceae bacterium]|nr:leucine-rich repeat domain-containing protein [Lachnospiraceae bacterium]
MTRRKFRRIFAVCLILAALIVGLLPTESTAAEETKSVLSEFELNGDTLVKYTGTATTVSVPSTVKTIGIEAFLDNSNVKIVNIPDSVETIDYASFSGCNNLQKITIPASIEEIGNAAFANCKSLKEVNLGVGVRKMGTGVFAGCEELATISASGNEYFTVSDGVIYDRDKETIVEVLQGRKAKDYTMPSTVKNIYPYAFYGCSNINTVTFSPYLDTIPAYSFSNCKGLSKVNISYSVNIIDMKAFEDCVNLYDVEIPLSVTYIHDTAFDGCPGLNIIAPEKSYADEWFKRHKKSSTEIIDEEDNSDKRGSGGASGNNQSGSSEPSRYTPDGMVAETIIVGRSAVFMIDNSSQIEVKEGPIVPRNDYSDEIDALNVLQAETNGKGLSLPKFSVVDGKIAGKAFYLNPMTAYEFPEDVTSIGDFSFARSGLKNITIPEGVTHIGYGAFYHCDDLIQILVPDTVTDIEASAFDHTRMLDNWKGYGSGNFLVMGDGILVAYRGYGSKVTIPEGIKQIGPQVFKDNLGVIEVTIPESVWRICEEAFSGCSKLNSVYGGMGVTTIEDRAFYGCPLKTVRVPESVETVGLEAYSLDGVNLNADEKSVVFTGTGLPSSSYIKTTSRLSNRAYRSDSFNGIKVAVVKDPDVNLAGTVLDKEQSGFSGLICTLAEEPNEYFNGTLHIVGCTLSAAEAAVFSVPSSMIIYGKGYNFRPQELEATLEAAKAGAYERRADTVNSEATAGDASAASPVAVSSTIEPFTFNGSDEAFELSVSMDSAVDAKLLEAYVRIYSDVVPSNLTTFDVTLKHKDTGVLITKLGKQTLTVSMDIPSNIPTKNLHVICTDDDNQLEDLPYKVVNEEGKLKIRFDISHTGKYGMYAYSEEQAESLSGVLDNTPDTGDYINPKWLLASGMLALGVALLLIKGKK